MDNAWPIHYIGKIVFEYKICDIFGNEHNTYKPW